MRASDSRSACHAIAAGRAARLIVGDGRVIVIDPWLTGNPSAPKGVRFERLDLILATHAHADHCSEEELTVRSEFLGPEYDGEKVLAFEDLLFANAVFMPMR